MSFLCCFSSSPSSLEGQNRQGGQNIAAAIAGGKSFIVLAKKFFEHFDPTDPFQKCTLCKPSIKKPCKPLLKCLWDEFFEKKLLPKWFYLGSALVLKPFCAKFPFQFPFGILREANDVTEGADTESSATLAQLGSEDRLEPFCLGICALTYKILWLVFWPICQKYPPFG